jgi:hypothetical protein
MRICWARVVAFAGVALIGVGEAVSQTVSRTAAAEARKSEPSAKRELIVNTDRTKVLLPNAAAPLAATQCSHAGGRLWHR